MPGNSISYHCVKSVRTRNFSGPYFPAFGLNTKRNGVSLRIQSERGNMPTRKTPNTDIFYAMYVFLNYFHDFSLGHRICILKISVNNLKGLSLLISFLKNSFLCSKYSRCTDS